MIILYFIYYYLHVASASENPLTDYYGNIIINSGASAAVVTNTFPQNFHGFTPIFNNPVGLPENLNPPAYEINYSYIPSQWLDLNMNYYSTPQNGAVSVESIYYKNWYNQENLSYQEVLPYFTTPKEPRTFIDEEYYGDGEYFKHNNEPCNPQFEEVFPRNLELEKDNIGIANSSNYNEIVEYYVNLINEEIPLAFTYSPPKDASEYKPESENITDFGKYDYIVVGAGSAGAVIANRLTEIPGNKVLLLEAGGHESDFSDIPGMGNFLLGSEFNWNFNSTTQKNICQGMLNKQCPYPRGKGLGGSSIINGLIYARGDKKDYNQWALQGNPGWSYEEVLPYFKKAENATLINGDEGYHGKHGPVHVEYIKPYNPQYYAFLDANFELGRTMIDYNGKKNGGVARTQFTNIHGRRDSTGKAYIDPIINRPNLKILTHTLAIKILIGKTKRAHGIVFSNSKNLFKATASKEIIISAGVIGSPQLLMLSGIGPALHLKNLGISVVQPLAVGNNLHDHTIYFGLNFQTNYTEPFRTLEENVERFLNASGPLTGNSPGVAFVQTNVTKTPNYPDIELLLNPSNNTGPFVEIAFHLTEETYNSVFSNVDPSRCFSINPMILRPKSRGTLRLKSKDPYTYPLIDPNALSHPDDVETLYEGIQLALQVANTEAFKKLNATLVDGTVPACRHLKKLSKAYWLCQIKYVSINIFHPVGTCKMGPNPLTGGAVVNHEGKVYGVKNLRVADASIIPLMTSGHINAPAIMIGEKISDMIKKEHFHI